VDAECLRQIELVLKREPEMAAVIGEPISATPVIPSRGYWKGVRRLCEQYGALLIFDEIIEGFGRTGKMFACEHFVTPDILVLGKSFGGGLMPFAGIVTRETFNVCHHRSVGHYTHEKNALCSAAALAEIAYIEENNLPDHAAELGVYALRRLNNEAEIIMFKCLEKGLSAKTIEGNILTLRPALVITRGEMDRAIDIIDEAIGEVEQGKKY
jgi:4-aminobutyrate aminotransferase